MISRLLRKIHMYLALFLMPWVLMYAISTIAMNHREPNPPVFEKVREMVWDGSFANGAGPRQKAEQLLASLGMDGAYAVQERDGRLIVTRFYTVQPVRLTLNSQEGRLLMERQQFRPGNFLERLHRRRGYQHNYLIDNLWAASVDLFIFAMLFWVISGLWLWWEIRSTRRWGALALATGLGIFAFFLVVL